MSCFACLRLSVSLRRTPKDLALQLRWRVSEPQTDYSTAYSVRIKCLVPDLKKIY